MNPSFYYFKYVSAKDEWDIEKRNISWEGIFGDSISNSTIFSTIILAILKIY